MLTNEEREPCEVCGTPRHCDRCDGCNCADLMNTTVVCICGSMRFAAAMQRAAIYETLRGRIVVMPHVNERHGDIDLWCEVTNSNPNTTKENLDRLHKLKIDLADVVLVVTNSKHYIGESTRSEIDFAESLGKPVEYWHSASQDGDQS